MPIYEYRCSDCSKIFETLVWNSKEADVKCPECKGERVERLLSAFCKGSGQMGKGVSIPSSPSCGPSGGGFS
jgi:putative FmdB family regulatory protein